MSTPSPQPQAHSRWIWPFEILEQIGEGGMGVVYRARYVVNDRQVALKMVPADVADKTALVRFERELEVLKTLRHPHIVRCFGGVCEDKRRFYAMELLEGGSLEDQLQAKGKLPWEQVVEYGLQMCEALECSHSKGVVHRDVKPSNFLLTSTGELKLSDFGLASVLAARKITATGKTAGTFLYMAPEQIRGQDITSRTDLYALGCVLYELVTGEVPFFGETPGATLHLHCFTPPSRPSEKVFDLPIQMERIILRLMEKDPAARYESAAAVARELKSIHQTVTVSVRSERHGNYPTGYHIPLKESQGHEQARTVQMPVMSMPAVSWNANRLLVGLLAVSLLGNVLLMLTRDSSGPRWKGLWMQALQSGNEPLQIAAIDSLGKMASRDSESLQKLTDLTGSENARIRAAAAQGLGTAGASASGRLPVLVKMQKQDADEEVRRMAEFAQNSIRQAGPDRRIPWGALILTFMLSLGVIAGIYYWFRRDETSPGSWSEAPSSES